MLYWLATVKPFPIDRDRIALYPYTTLAAPITRVLARLLLSGAAPLGLCGAPLGLCGALLITMECTYAPLEVKVKLWIVMDGYMVRFAALV